MKSETTDTRAAIQRTTAKAETTTIEEELKEKEEEQEQALYIEFDDDDVEISALVDSLLYSGRDQDQEHARQRELWGELVQWVQDVYSAGLVDRTYRLYRGRNSKAVPPTPKEHLDRQNPGDSAHIFLSDGDYARHISTWSHGTGVETWDALHWQEMGYMGTIHWTEQEKESI